MVLGDWFAGGCGGYDLAVTIIPEIEALKVAPLFLGLFGARTPRRYGRKRLALIGLLRNSKHFRERKWFGEKCV